MNAPIVIAPVRKSVRVKAPVARAFDVFTSGLSRWWPLDHGVPASSSPSSLCARRSWKQFRRERSDEAVAVRTTFNRSVGAATRHLL